MPKARYVIDGWDLTGAQLDILAFLNKYPKGKKAWDIGLRAKIPYSTVITNLRFMRDSGLILESKAYYRINPKLTSDIGDLLKKYKKILRGSHGPKAKKGR